VKNILYFCSAFPVPIDDGIKKISTNLIRQFCEDRHNVSLVLPYYDKSSTKLPKFMQKLPTTFYTKKRTFKKILRNLFRLEPLYFGLYYDDSLITNINKELYDLIIYDFYPLTQYGEGLKKELFLMPDSMKKLAYSNFSNEKQFLRKSYYFVNYLLSINYNKKISSFKKLYVSTEDIEFDKLDNSQFFKVPADNVDYKCYQEKPYNTNEIIFRGVMDFEPNISAVTSFYNDIFVKMGEEFKMIHLKIIGKNPTEAVLNFQSNRCEVTGYVDDVFEAMAHGGIHIVPMVSGSGVKTKMIDSISLKRLVFASPQAINGIFNSVDEARNNGIVIYNNNDDFIENIRKYIQGEINYKDMTERAYSYLIQESYHTRVEELLQITNN